MRVQVAEDEGESREFVDGVVLQFAAVAGALQDPAGVPADAAPEILIVQIGLGDEAIGGEVAGHQGEDGGQEAGEVAGTDPDLGPRQPEQVATERIGHQRNEAEDAGDGQVEGHRQGGAGQVTERPVDEVSEVVVVDRQTGHPGVGRGKGGTAHNGAEHGELHRLLGADDVRVARPVQGEEYERHREDDFPGQHLPATFAQTGE